MKRCAWVTERTSQHGNQLLSLLCSPFNPNSKCFDCKCIPAAMSNNKTFSLFLCLRLLLSVTLSFSSASHTPAPVLPLSSPLTSSDSPLLSGPGRNVWGSMFCSGRAGLDPLFCRTGNHINRPPVPFGWEEYCKCSWSQFVRWSRVSGLLLSSRLDRGKNTTVFEFDVDRIEKNTNVFNVKLFAKWTQMLCFLMHVMTICLHSPLPTGFACSPFLYDALTLTRKTVADLQHEITKKWLILAGSNRQRQLLLADFVGCNSLAKQLNFGTLIN